MKRSVLNLMLALVCAAGLAAITTAAVADELMTAKIPFAFSIGKQTLPAGTYKVSRATSPGLVILRNENLTRTVAFIVHVDQGGLPHKKATLAFHRYGDQYFLATIQQAYSANTMALPTSRREREIANAAKNLASNQTGPEVVTITAE